MGTRPPINQTQVCRKGEICYVIAPKTETYGMCSCEKKKGFSKPNPAIHADANIHHANQREIRVGRKEAGQTDVIWADADAPVYSLLPPQGSGELEQGKRSNGTPPPTPRIMRNICGKCRQPKTAPDHRHNKWFCRATLKKTTTEWEERMKFMGYTSRKRKHSG